MNTPRVPFLLRWMWLIGVVIAVVAIVRAMNNHRIPDSVTAGAIGWATVIIVVDVIAVLIFLAQARPADYQAVKEIAGAASMLYLAHEVYEHDHEYHIRHAVEGAFEDHDGMH